MAQILTILFLLQLSLFAEFKVKSFLEIKYIDVVKQTYEESCGVSALATLLREPLIINYQEHFSNLSRNFS